MKEQNSMDNHEKKKMTKEKRFYLITGIASAVALAAIVLIAVLVTSLGDIDTPIVGNNSSSSVEEPNSSSGGSGNVGDNTDPNEPVITTPEGMQMPLESVSVLHEFGFYHNKTLNNYYEHTGVDFTAEVGAEVLAVDDGVIESIYRDDVLTGTEILIDHGDGMKTLYRFVTLAEDISVGKEVKKGDVIATVAEATGEEYKDGAHLHFEVIKSGEQVDPSTYLTFEEK